MADRGQITGALLDGPLAMDDAISPEAASIKGIVSSVAGAADILIAPNLEAGNILYKSLTYLAGADTAGVIVGAAVPIILASRADSVRTRVGSAALASILSSATGCVAPLSRPADVGGELAQRQLTR
jgi:phosphate acetyltransferase